MDDAALYAELRTLGDNPPDFATFKSGSRVHHEWLARVRNLIAKWDESRAPSAQDIAQLSSFVYRDDSLNKIMTALYDAIADLQYSVQATVGRAYGPGAVYDFFKNLRELLASATSSIFIIDPYLDDQIFDAYLSAVLRQVSVRLLTNKGASALKPALVRFIAQTNMSIQVRRSNRTHDRVFFLDDRSCWVMGQSIKDAASSKPTYLAPLDNETAELKKEFYEEIWTAATPI
jgi:hypothetical protein